MPADRKALTAYIADHVAGSVSPADQRVTSNAAFSLLLDLELLGLGIQAGDDTFEQLLERAPQLACGWGSERGWDRQVDHLNGSRRGYVRDPGGQSYEFFTAVPPP